MASARSGSWKARSPAPLPGGKIRQAAIRGCCRSRAYGGAGADRPRTRAASRRETEGRALRRLRGEAGGEGSLCSGTMPWCASLVREQFALDDLVDDRSDAVSILRGRVEQAVHLGAVAGRDRRARRVQDELREHVSGDLAIVLEQQPLQLDHVTEALAPGELAARIDRLREAEGV